MRALVLGLLFLSASASPEHHGTTTKPHWLGKENTFRLVFTSAICSGTAIGPHTILSASHCFMRGEPLAIVGDRPVKSSVLYADGNDHTIAVVDLTFTTWARVVPTPLQGDQVHIWGNPVGLPNILRVGRVAGWYAGDMLMDLNSWHGDSGAGIFDDAGNVVGVDSGNYGEWIQGEGVFHLAYAKPLRFTSAQIRSIR